MLDLRGRFRMRFLNSEAISAKGQQWCRALSSLHKLRVLSMSSCNLSGPIDSSFAKLQSLTVLNLSHNNMSSTVPESFAKLSKLVQLQLRSCGLNGSFPKDIFQIPTLRILDISDNKGLRGSLPNFRSHGSLYDMNLSNTNFSGMLPGEISNLKLLSRIDLSSCQFNGTLPSSISELSQLVYIDLSYNNFIGSLPSFNMSKNLTYLSLYHNHLAGVLSPNHFEVHKNLVSIDLGFNLFRGKLPSSLLKLPCLRELKVPFNQFNGSLDEFVIASPLLEMLNLGNNNFHGTIPVSIFNTTTLRLIQLNANKLNGTIQLDKIRKLGNLTYLGLSNNNLSVDINYRDVHDPSNYPNLKFLMLSSCKLRGMPSFLRNQSTLLHLDLADNEIEGSIPHWIWQNEYLTHLNLSKNFLTSFEGSFWNLSSNLFLLDLSFNQLQGSFPFIPTLVNCLDYSNNRFNSVIPVDIGNRLPFLSLLSFSNNSFQGQIPESFCNASSLDLLDLSHNNFVGTIPKCFATMSNLRVLNFGANKLRGYIPDSMPTSCILKLLDLNDNLLEGTIPKSLAHCQNLQVLNLRKNSLTDRFPCFLSNISTLRIMDLGLNKLHGSIRCPRSSGDWKMLHMVNLASNDFNGAIPGELLNSWKAMMRDDANGVPESGHLFIDLSDHGDPKNFEELLSNVDKYLLVRIAKLITNVSLSILDQLSTEFFNSVDISRLQNSITITNKGRQMELVRIQKIFKYLDMSSNNFEGPIPNELMQLKALNALNLSNNALSGHIPSSIGNLKNLESLDLSENYFDGLIPTELASLSFLAYLNLSFNHLVGEIPKGTQIQSFDADSFEGNEELCGVPLIHSCSNDEGTTPETLNAHSHTESAIDWNILSAELGCIFGFGIFILPLIFSRRWKLWYSEHVDEMLHRIIPQLEFVYEHSGGNRYKTLRWKN
ncbi:receptor like protein 28-like isoform X2 [Vigna unguiculata]|uniref:receptor like protein 28-like isoform X2 n=1 Tax=Vigna unguiculata TaxID=3917 RepID=UPI0010168786|nr:receptor like protein 28-like isoform X2 [Vigna unguiculata]